MLRTTSSIEQTFAASIYSKRSVSVYPVLLLVLGLTGLFAFHDQLLALPLETICNIASVSMLVVLVIIIRSTRLGLWSASAMYVLVFSLFHFGATIVYGLSLPISSYLDLVMGRWFYLSDNREAILLAIIGLLACGLGIYVALIVKPPVIVGREPILPFDDILGIAGFILTALCVFGWFATVIASGGLSLLVGTYRSLLDSTSGSLLTYIYYGFGLGVTFLAAAPATKLRASGFALFGLWCLFALPLGLRGEVLFPTSAALVVAARRRIPLSGKQVLAGGMVLLILIALIREVRQVGLEGYSLSEMHIAPQDALAELGGSLRPVTVVVLWHRAGDDLIHGASYWAPIERGLFRMIPDLSTQRVAAYDDERLLNVLVQNRIGFIGFSPVAEAYYNFGAAGVLIIMMTTGLLLGYLDHLSSTRLNQAICGVVLVPLLIQVRNAFTQVPAQLLVGFGAVGVIVILSRLLQTHKHYEFDSSN